MATAEQHRIVITGASGLLGRHVLEVLANRPGTQLLGLVRTGSKPWVEKESVRHAKVDLLDAKATADVVHSFKPTAVIHCAAIGMRLPRPSWAELLRFNVDVSLRLCEIVSRIPACRFVHVSTGLAYRDQGRLLREEDPLETLHPYGASKAAGEILVRSVAADLGVPLTVLRPFSFSGVGDTGSRLFPSLLRAAAEERPFDLSPGDQIREHCAVTDIARGVAQAVLRSAELPVRIFNLGSGSTLPLRRLVEGVVEQLGLKVTLNFSARDYAPFEPKFLAADISRARTELNWEPQTNFAYAVWQLAQEFFPALKIKQPRQFA